MAGPGSRIGLALAILLTTDLATYYMGVPICSCTYT